MKKEKKITLPKDLQEQMLNFFLKTSIKRKQDMKEKKPLSNEILDKEN